MVANWGQLYEDQSELISGHCHQHPRSALDASMLKAIGQIRTPGEGLDAAAEEVHRQRGHPSFLICWFILAGGELTKSSSPNVLNGLNEMSWWCWFSSYWTHFQLIQTPNILP